MRIRVRHTFIWDGRQSNGSVAPDGTYDILVHLVQENRSALISNSTAAEPVTVETVPPRPRVTSVSPSLIPQPGNAGAAIHYTGNRGLSGRILIYRTDVSGPPRLVKSFASRRGSVSSWDGRLTGGRPAPQGTYLVGFKVTDRACNTGRFPAELPPVAGTTRGAGVTVRYLAAQPPLTPVPAGSSAIVYVDARRHEYHWALRRAGAQKVLSSGAGSNYALSVRPPRRRTGALRTGDPVGAAPDGCPAGRGLRLRPRSRRGRPGRAAGPDLAGPEPSRRRRRRAAQHARGRGHGQARAPARRRAAGRVRRRGGPDRLSAQLAGELRPDHGPGARRGRRAGPAIVSRRRVSRATSGGSPFRWHGRCGRTSPPAAICCRWGSTRCAGRSRWLTEWLGLRAPRPRPTCSARGRGAWSRPMGL